MQSRLNNGRGETLVETLVALLISAISLIMFANMLAPAVNLTKKGRGWNEDVNKRSTFLEERPSQNPNLNNPNEESDLEMLLKDLLGVDELEEGDNVETALQREFNTRIVSGTVSIENLIESADVTLYVTDYDGKEQVISYETGTP